MTEQILKVNGMMCSACVASIETALKVTRGVKSASAHLEEGVVNVVYDENVTTPEAIQSVVQGLGFEVLV